MWDGKFVKTKPSPPRLSKTHVIHTYCAHCYIDYSRTRSHALSLWLCGYAETQHTRTHSPAHTFFYMLNVVRIHENKTKTHRSHRVLKNGFTQALEIMSQHILTSTHMHTHTHTNTMQPFVLNTSCSYYHMWWWQAHLREQRVCMEFWCTGRTY